MIWKGFWKEFRRIVDRPVRSSTVLAGALPHARLQVLEPLGEESRLGRIADLAAREEAAEHDARRFELVHVLEDEDLHLPRPQRYVGRARVAVDRRGIASCERKIVQPMLGEEGRLGERLPAVIRIDEEL